jgi:4-diphosphocytidyl-2C-methyl-D-erythritol kinase
MEGSEGKGGKGEERRGHGASREEGARYMSKPSGRLLSSSYRHPCNMCNTRSSFKAYPDKYLQHASELKIDETLETCLKHLQKHQNTLEKPLQNLAPSLSPVCCVTFPN